MLLPETFNALEWEQQRAQRERDLLSKAQAKPGKAGAKAKAGDDAAASELLYWYAKCGKLSSPEAQSAIEAGIRNVINQMLSISTIPGERNLDVQPLMYFGGEKRKPGPRKSAELLELRIAFGDLMTLKQAKAAIATRWKGLPVGRIEHDGGTLYKSELPKTIEQTEKRLVGFIQEIFKDVSLELAKRYVRLSFPRNQWENPHAPIKFPDDWGVTEIPAQFNL